MDDRVGLEVARLRLEREHTIEKEQDAAMLREIQAVAADLAKGMRELEQRQAALVGKLKGIAEERAKEKEAAAEEKKQRTAAEESERAKAARAAAARKKEKEKEREEDGDTAEAGDEAAKPRAEKKQIAPPRRQSLQERLSRKRSGSGGSGGSAGTRASPEDAPFAGFKPPPKRRGAAGRTEPLLSPQRSQQRTPSSDPAAKPPASPVLVEPTPSASVRREHDEAAAAAASMLPPAEVLTTGCLASIMDNATTISKEDESKYLAHMPLQLQKRVPTLLSTPPRGSY